MAPWCPTSTPARRHKAWTSPTVAAAEPAADHLFLETSAFGGPLPGCSNSRPVTSPGSLPGCPSLGAGNRPVISLGMPMPSLPEAGWVRRAFPSGNSRLPGCVTLSPFGKRAGHPAGFVRRPRAEVGAGYQSGRSRFPLLGTARPCLGLTAFPAGGPPPPPEREGLTNFDELTNGPRTPSRTTSGFRTAVVATILQDRPIRRPLDGRVFAPTSDNLFGNVIRPFPRAIKCARASSNRPGER